MELHHYRSLSYFQYIKRAQAQSQQLSMPTSPRMTTPPWQASQSSQTSLASSPS